jgi:hypothetical protein
MSHAVTSDFTSATNAELGNRWLSLMGVLAAMLVVSAPQIMGALVEPEDQWQAPLLPVKPMTPENMAWLKDRCERLVAYFDRYGGTGGKHYDVPPAATGLAQTPVPPLRPHGEARSSSQ